MGLPTLGKVKAGPKGPYARGAAPGHHPSRVAKSGPVGFPEPRQTHGAVGFGPEGP